MIQNNITAVIMKNLHKVIAITTLLLTPLLHQAQSKVAKIDTVIINFGNSSKIVFYINEKGDLKALQSYDLNALISDMKAKIEADTIVSSQEDGDKYLKDSIANADPAIENQEENLVNSKEDNYSYDNRNNDNYQDNDNSQNKDDDDRWRGNVEGNRVTIEFNPDHFLNFDIGINNYLEDGKSPSNNNAQHTVKPLGSWYFAINAVNKSHLAGKLSLEWGGGISWYNFKFEDASTRLVKTDTDLQFVSSSTGDSFKKSKLTASFVNVNFIPVLDFSSRKKESVRIGIGGYGGYRLGSHTKYRYKLDGSNEKDKEKNNFFLSNWRYGVRLQLGYREIDIFINYDLNNLFSEGRASKLNAFSFGITI